MKRLFLKVSDLEILTGTKKRNCYAIMRLLKDALSKKKITINDYCKYYDVEYEVVCAKLLNVK